MIDLIVLLEFLFAFFLGVIFGKFILTPRKVGTLQITKTADKDLYNLIVEKPLGTLDNKKTVTFRVRKENSPYSGTDVDIFQKEESHER